MMTTSSQLRQLVRRAGDLPAPVLSLYVPVTPGRGDRVRRATMRVNSTLSKMDLPEAVRERAEHVLSDAEGDVEGRTLVVFASENEVLVRWLGRELPPDRDTGGVYARWGAVDVAPLLLLEGDMERAAALYADRDHWRLFDVSLDDVREVDSGRRSESAAEHDRLQQSKQEHPAYIPTRGGSALDDANRHLAELAQRFHRGAVERLSEFLPEGAQVVLLGTAAAVADLEALLSNDLRARVAARLPGLTRPDAPAAELRDRVSPTLLSMREARRRQLVDSARAGGVAGLAATLRELQQGRLSAVMVAWPVAGITAFEHEGTGYVSASERDARVDDGDIQPVELLPALQRLSREYATRLEFVTGDHAAAIAGELGGVAGIPRWP